VPVTHPTCLIGVVIVLRQHKAEWSSTLLVLFQLAEELGRGASGMILDGLFEHSKPDIILAQHVGPLPAGIMGSRSGPLIVGHSSPLRSMVDPILMAANLVPRHV
jgi:metal-dependent amidase/aminoacylase/carboxypeptidase family protein